MNNLVKTYSRKPKQIEAVQLTRENAYDVAIWCGGEVKETQGDQRDVADVHIQLVVPNVYGNDNATIGTFIIRDLSDGRFFVKSENFFVGEYETEEEVKIVVHVDENFTPKMGPLTPHYVPRGRYDRG